MTTGRALVKCFTRGGYHAVGYPEYPSLIRGGHNTVQVRVSDKPVNSPLQTQDLVIALNKDAVFYHMSTMAKDGVMIYDELIDIVKFPVAPGVKMYPLPLSKLTQEAGGTEQMKNTAALGAALAAVVMEEVVQAESLSMPLPLKVVGTQILNSKNEPVLLRGVNDRPEIMERLCRSLVRMRVRPYYLFQCDLVRGVEHFRTPLARGIEIMEYLRGRLSGLAIPLFVVDAPHGGGKIPVLPTYVVSTSPTHTVLRNFEGMLVSYPEPAAAGDERARAPDIRRASPRRLGRAGACDHAGSVPRDHRPRALRRKARAGSRDARSFDRRAHACRAP